MIAMSRRLIAAENNRVFVNGQPLFDQVDQLNKRYGNSGFTLRFSCKSQRCVQLTETA